jgi:CRISPR-associated protein Cas5h
MKAISFILGGKTAMFKKPDVNSYAYFTYNNIHKPALLGILGSIIGLGGYTQLFNKNKQIEVANKSIKKKEDKKSLDDGFPEFYEKLKDLKISIRPLGKLGYFSKKIQVFNNSVGYASKELGGNLIVREQWLENPSWQIIILEDDSDEFIKLKEYIINKKSVFIPYLGKNDHPANIKEAFEIELDDILNDDMIYIDSLFEKEHELDGLEKEGELPFLFQEVSPSSLHKDYHFYEYKTLCFTNCELNEYPLNTYSYKKKNYTFM